MVLLVDYVAVFAALAKNQDNHENSASKTNGNHRKPDDYVYRHFFARFTSCYLQNTEPFGANHLVKPDLLE